MILFTAGTANRSPAVRVLGRTRWAPQPSPRKKDDVGHGLLLPDARRPTAMLVTVGGALVGRCAPRPSPPPPRLLAGGFGTGCARSSSTWATFHPRSASAAGAPLRTSQTRPTTMWTSLSSRRSPTPRTRAGSRDTRGRASRWTSSRTRPRRAGSRRRHGRARSRRSACDRVHAIARWSRSAKGRRPSSIGMSEMAITRVREDIKRMGDARARRER